MAKISHHYVGVIWASHYHPTSQFESVSVEDQPTDLDGSELASQPDFLRAKLDCDAEGYNDIVDGHHGTQSDVSTVSDDVVYEFGFRDDVDSSGEANSSSDSDDDSALLTDKSEIFTENLVDDAYFAAHSGVHPPGAAAVGRLHRQNCLAFGGLQQR